ncbi:hypothetical protein M569_01560, partial [Genlisea aurea]
MRLRLRNVVGSRETLKLDAPNSCSLPHLKRILAQMLPNSPSPDSIHLSLNRKDELQSEGQESLQSLGVASGDLIFFSLELAGFDSNSPILMESNVAQSSEKPVTTVDDDNENHGGEAVVADMEIVGDSESLSAAIIDRSFSVPGFLRKVLTEEMNNDDGRGHKLLVIAVHAVMLESGFVELDKNSNALLTGFHHFRKNDWPVDLFKLSLYYTLNTVRSKAVKLKFQSIGGFINIYGTLDDGSAKRDIYRVQLNEDRLVPRLNIVWANCCDMENLNEVGSADSPEKQVFEFWRSVKDNLALPLSIDLCQEAGLRLPPCFIGLPTDLKLKILELLSGIDLARVICVCSELRYLGSNDDLWKLKFTEEFSNRRKDPEFSWKTAFVTAWNMRKKAAATSSTTAMWPAMYYGQPRRRYPNPFMIPRLPGVIGGDHDLFPP